MVAGRTPVSETERRQLAQWPQLTWQSLYTGRWMQDAEQAAADQFPCRDLFRHGKAQFVYHVLLQGENNGIYLRGGSAAKLDYPLNEASVSHLAQVILDIQNTYLKDTQVHCYYSIVPDKNAYLAGWYPTMDYHRLTQQLEALLPMTYVDLFPCLTGDSYYRTDPHWRQDALQPVVEALTSAMDVPLSWDLTAQDAGRFSGAYTGQSSSSRGAADTVRGPSCRSGCRARRARRAALRASNREGAVSSSSRYSLIRDRPSRRRARASSM